MGRQEIDCTVTTCFYYDAGNRCTAEKITVRNNPQRAGNSKFEVGDLGNSPSANDSQETMCETFTHKGKGPKPGINRIN